MPPKYEFYDLVKIITDSKVLAKVNNKLGAIFGVAKTEEGGWVYSVYILNREQCFYVEENDLEKTGKKIKRDEFFDGTHVRVDVKNRTKKDVFKL